MSAKIKTFHFWWWLNTAQCFVAWPFMRCACVHAYKCVQYGCINGNMCLGIASTHTHTHTHTQPWVRAEDEQKEDESLRRVCKCFCLLVTVTGAAVHSLLYCMVAEMWRTKWQLEETVWQLCPLVLEGDIRRGWRCRLAAIRSWVFLWL